jgi:hypothetical protein
VSQVGEISNVKCVWGVAGGCCRKPAAAGGELHRGERNGSGANA